jgi:hypothetical protein
MAESTLSVTRADLKRHIGRYLGISRTYTDWDTDTGNDVDDCIESGERNFYQPFNGHIWSFLNQVTTIALTAPYTTGTIGIVNGVVTLSVAGTWPSWAATGYLHVDGSTYAVSTRDGNNQLTLEDTSVDVDALSTYELRRLQYTMVDGFGGFTDPYLSFSVDYQMWYPVKLTGPEQILAMRQTDAYGSENQPLFAAVTASPLTMGTAGQRWALMVYPAATEAGVISGKYYVLPSTISDNTYYPFGGQPHAETLIQSCLAAAERLMNDERGIHQAQFQERLLASVKLDKDLTTPKLFGYNGDKSGWQPPIGNSHARSQYITYNDTAYLG